MEKIKISKLILVEGKYDKITLENIVDADIIAVDGFGAFKNKQRLETIKRLASQKGAIIFTDSDVAGYKIRVYLEKVLCGKNVVNAFIPQIEGKEKRKENFSKQGYLGVEGMDATTIKNALLPYVSDTINRNDIDVSTLFKLGYTGSFNSKQKKNQLLKSLGIQVDISNKFLLRILNERFTIDEFINYNKLLEGENLNGNR